MVLSWGQEWGFGAIDELARRKEVCTRTRSTRAYIGDGAVTVRKLSPNEQIARV